MADDEKPPEVDEKYLLQWFEYGYSALGVYMKKAAAFNDYYERRSREEEQDAETTPES